MTYRRRDLLAAAAASPLLAAAPTQGTGASARPFSVAIPDATLDRIARRVADPHLPHRAAGTRWQYGLDREWFNLLLAYWRDGYDWRAQERAINRLPQFTATIDGRQLHFVHRRSSNPAARPLLLLHGWPYNFWSFSEVIAPLSRDFHVVVPSLPGFAFSDPIADTPRGLRAMSQPIHHLMTEVLGYPRYIVQGADFGAVMADWLALDHAPAIIGEHTNLIAFRHRGAEYGSGKTGLSRPTPAEQRFVAEEQETFRRESGYFALQSTRPETIAYALADSPVGAAAYLLDKWQKWTNSPRPFDALYGRDRLLTEVMLYLATDSLATSLWPYAGFAGEPFSLNGRTIDVPFGFSGRADPLNAPPPRAFAAHGRTRIVQWDVAPTGGHFPFLEDPERFVADVRRFAAKV
jgi:pimeloyl-ACP methyl ester carboxylesterase